MINKKYIVIAFIFLTALILRFSFLELSVYDDSITKITEDADTILDGKLQLNGMMPWENNQQQTFGPFYFYLLAFFRLISKNYLMTVFMTALFSFISVLMAYKFSKQFFGFKTALVSSALFAVSPWMILYARIPVQFNVLILLIICSFFSFFKIIYENKQKYFVLLGLLFGLMANVYLISMQIIFVFFILFMIHFKKIKKIKIKYFLYAAFLFFLTLVPFAIYSFQIGSNPINEAINVVSYAKADLYENTIFINLRDSIAIPIVFTTNYIGDYFVGTPRIFNLAFYYYFNFIIILSVLIFIISFLWIVKQNRFNFKSKYAILLLWLAIPILMMIVRNRNVAPHYLITTIPVQFILIGEFISKYLPKTKIKKFTKRIIIFCFLLIFISHIAHFFFFYSYVDKQAGATPPSFGIPYKYWREAAFYIIEDSRPNEPSIIILNETRIHEIIPVMKGLKTDPAYLYIDNIEDLPGLDGYYVASEIPYEIPEEHKVVLDKYKSSMKKIGGIEIYKIQ